jgi:hypothetical protein
MRTCLFIAVLSLVGPIAHGQTEGGLSNISFDQNRIEKAAHAGDRWSMFAADTVGDGENLVGARLGWPDLTLEFLHGVSPTVDIGGEFQLSYAFEGTTINNKVGIGFAAPIRGTVFHNDKISVLLHIDPGIKILTGLGPAKFGVQAQAGFALAFRVGSALHVGFGVDVPFVIYFTGDQNPIVAIPPIFGPFLEYHVDKHFTLGLDTRFGILWYSVGDLKDAFGDVIELGFNDTQFAFRVQFVVGYRL